MAVTATGALRWVCPYLKSYKTSTFIRDSWQNRSAAGACTA